MDDQLSEKEVMNAILNPVRRSEILIPHALVGWGKAGSMYVTNVTIKDGRILSYRSNENRIFNPNVEYVRLPDGSEYRFNKKEIVETTTHNDCGLLKFKQLVPTQLDANQKVAFYRLIAAAIDSGRVWDYARHKSLYSNIDLIIKFIADGGYSRVGFLKGLSVEYRLLGELLYKPQESLLVALASSHCRVYWELELFFANTGNQYTWLLDEFFGTVDPALAIPDEVRAVASGIYEDGAYETVCVLGDMLEEQGFPDDALIKHCHLPKHYKGCYVIEAFRYQ